MDNLIKRFVALVASTKRPSVPWTADEPSPQPYYTFSEETGEWRPINAGSTTPTQHGNAAAAAAAVPSRLALYSWNIDFMLPFPDSRMNGAIQHLQTLVGKEKPQFATVIYLQECVKRDLELLTRNEWIRETFSLSDTGVENWQNGYYGTVTLVDRRLTIERFFRVHYSRTRMERDVLVADIKLPSSSSSNATTSKTIRLCNSHLESLAFEPALRPSQVQLMARYMHDRSVDGAVAAGDFNAIQDFDRHLHTDNDLKDAFLELGGREEDATGGHTWGQQTSTANRERFGTSRMDKVFFCGGIRCIRFGRFGAGVEVTEQHERSAIVALGFKQPWITDHLGVMGVFEAE